MMSVDEFRFTLNQIENFSDFFALVGDVVPHKPSNPLPFTLLNAMIISITPINYVIELIKYLTLMLPIEQPYVSRTIGQHYQLSLLLAMTYYPHSTYLWDLIFTLQGQITLYQREKRTTNDYYQTEFNELVDKRPIHFGLGGLLSINDEMHSLPFSTHHALNIHLKSYYNVGYDIHQANSVGKPFGNNVNVKNIDKGTPHMVFKDRTIRRAKPIPDALSSTHHAIRPQFMPVVNRIRTQLLLT